jgi:hypothetical protein
VYLGDSMIVRRKQIAMTAGITPTPITHLQIESSIFSHSRVHWVTVASDGMPSRCLTAAIKAMRVAASCPKGWHMNTRVSILPRSGVGPNLRSTVREFSRLEGRQTLNI